MAKTTLKNVTLLYGPRDISGDTNQLDVPVEKPPVRVTNFASSGWEEYLLGHGGGQWTFSGFQGGAEPDNTLFGNHGADPVALTYSLSNPLAAGDITYTGQCIKSQYSLEETVGDAAKFSVNFSTSAHVLRGKCLETVTATATGNSSGLNHGAVLAAQNVYAVLQVLAVSGTTPNMVLKVQSDGDNLWASATDVITFDAVTDTLGPSWYQIKSVAGAISDSWWRGSRTITGTNPSFQYRLFLVIQ